MLIGNLTIRKMGRTSMYIFEAADELLSSIVYSPGVLEQYRSSS